MAFRSTLYAAALLIPLCAHAQGVGLQVSAPPSQAPAINTPDVTIPSSFAAPATSPAPVSGGNTVQLPPDTGHDDAIAKAASDKAALSTPKNDTDGGHNLFNSLNLSSESSERVRSSIKFCAESMDKAVRLSCYEDFSRSMGVEVKEITDGSASENGVWAVKNDNQTYDYIAMLESPKMGSENQHLDLYVRCHQKQMTFYIKPGINIGEQTISVAIGGDGVSDGKVYQMKPSKTGDAFGFWNDTYARIMYNFFAEYNNPMPISFALEGHLYKTTFDLKRMYADTAQVRMACKK